MFEKRVEDLHETVQEGMKTGKLGTKDASRLVVELQDVSGCVYARTHTTHVRGTCGVVDRCVYVCALYVCACNIFDGIDTHQQ